MSPKVNKKEFTNVSLKIKTIKSYEFDPILNDCVLETLSSNYWFTLNQNKILFV